MRELSDADGGLARLALELGGRGVPSLGEALRELEMAPFHVALRTDDATAAVRQAAALIGREPPAGISADGAARAVDEYLLKERPDLARGRWIYEWHLEDVVPDADLTALRLDLAARQARKEDGASPHTLLKDDRFRRLIGVNEADGVTWFNKEDFERVVTALVLPRVGDLVAAAAKSGYKLDELAKLVSEPPPWASTRPPRPAPRGGRSANTRDQSMPPRPQQKATTPPKSRPARATRTKEK
jgi:hypothetical protein